VSLTHREPARFVTLPASGSGHLIDVPYGAIAGYPSGSSLFSITHKGEISSTPLLIKGVSAMANIGGKIVCVAEGSAVMRLLALNGREQRLFVGHCGPVKLLQKIVENMFASWGQDDSIRIWDIRDRASVATILAPSMAVTAMTGSSEYLICGFQNKRIGVIDIANRKPLFGVETNDFVPASMAFDKGADVLYAFGAHDSQRGPQPRAVFGDNERQFEQKVFRKCSSFIGTRRM
jgi:WD40 repeat protein